jgi:hypothetical protein
LILLRRSKDLSPPANFVPGGSTKRWLIVFGLGLFVVVLGIDYLLVDLYKTLHFPAWAVPWIKAVTLQSAPRAVRGAVFLIAGAFAILFAIRHYGYPTDVG